MTHAQYVILSYFELDECELSSTYKEGESRIATFETEK